MYSNSVRSLSALRVKYFITVTTYGVITHSVKTCVERKLNSLASTYYKTSVSLKFCKLSDGDKLEITNLYAVCVSCHSLLNTWKNIQTCAKRRAVKQ